MGQELPRHTRNGHRSQHSSLHHVYRSPRQTLPRSQPEGTSPREQMMAKGRCFNCAEKGNRVPDCNQPKKKLLTGPRPTITSKRPQWQKTYGNRPSSSGATYGTRPSGSNPMQGRDCRGRFTQIRALQEQGQKIFESSKTAWDAWNEELNKAAREEEEEQRTNEPEAFIDRNQDC